MIWVLFLSNLYIFWLLLCYRKEWVVVGGTRQANDGNTEIVQKDFDDVWNRACEVVPSLKVSTIQ